MPESSSAKWAGPLIGAGASVLGGLLTGRSQQKQSERQWELLEAEMRRRNQMQGMIAPQLLHAAGIRNPQQVAAYTQQIRGEAPPPTQPQGGGLVPQTPSSTVGKIGGGIGTGMAVASAASKLPGLGALGIGGAAMPIVGGALLGGSLIANQIGKGRRTANLLTDRETGAEGQLLNALYNPQASPDELKRAYQNYLQTIEAFRSQGGNHRKVAEQSLANQPLQDTIRRRLAELGG